MPTDHDAEIPRGGFSPSSVVDRENEKAVPLKAGAAVGHGKPCEIGRLPVPEVSHCAPSDGEGVDNWQPIGAVARRIVDGLQRA